MPEPPEDRPDDRDGGGKRDRTGRGGDVSGKRDRYRTGRGGDGGRLREGSGRAEGDGRDRAGRGRGGKRREGPGGPRHRDRDGRKGPERADASARGGPAAAEAELPVDADVTGRELDEEVRAELGTLSKSAADDVARRLVMAARLVDDDPEQAYQHALAARRRAARVGVVREAAGVAAYLAGRYAEALGELRAARRITGSAEYLPMMADCERGLGRPRRALDLSADPAGAGLTVAGRIELLIVAAGARRDLGDLAAAVVSLQVPELRMDTKEPWLARLRYAYADALEAAGRISEARRWFLRAVEVDVDEETDAADRIAALDDGSPAAD